MHETVLAQSKAARDAELAQNKVTLGRINIDALPRWTATLENQRFLIEAEGEELSSYRQLQAVAQLRQLAPGSSVDLPQILEPRF
jgi:hypothetical protein